MHERITIDSDRKLYVIPFIHGKHKGYTCLGFEYAFEKAEAIANWLIGLGLRVSLPKREKAGTISAFREYKHAVKAARLHFERTKERCPVELCPQLLGLEGRRVEVIDGYGSRRRFYVGKSTGWVPCHLEIARSDSTGGPAVTGAPFQSVIVLQKARRRY